MNAEQWLNEEGEDITEVLFDYTSNKLFNLMERFANHRTKELEAGIIDFRFKLESFLPPSENKQKLERIFKNGYRDLLMFGVNSYNLTEIEKLITEDKPHPLITMYDNYFGLTTQREGSLK